ncbi:MAG: ATP-binding cassette domain-containing protein [Actinobacteria bacterium]|nr:ATP-binding cassette domain-containing protein [Actinomycetota bacterium]
MTATAALGLHGRRGRRADAALAAATDAPVAGQGEVRPRLALWSVVAVVAHVAVYAVFVASWAVIGAPAVRGDIDGGDVARWAVLVAALIPLRWLATTGAGYVAVDVGRRLKQRLLDGVLGLEPDAVRHAGVGSFLGTTLEAEAVETLALSGGHLAVLGVVECVAASVAVAAGARPGPVLALLASTIAVVVALAALEVVRRRAWSRRRLAMTHELVERMVGHRTRLAQAGEALFDATGDEQAVADYERVSRRMDDVAAVALAVVPRAWVAVAAVALLVPTPADASPARLAASVGGVLLASHALRKLTLGASQLAAARVAWEQIAGLVRSRPPQGASADDDGHADGAGDGNGGDDAVVEAVDVRFAYADRALPVLAGASVRLAHGDRVLLEGPSGGGKSTLAALLTGLRAPHGGVVRRGGVVVGVPQFHENHLFAAPLAFNLLCGRRWPPAPDDLVDADAVCRELGLGDVLDRMPGGLQQPVGETGWQLSHGERSRVFLARALLQRPDAVVLDETFASLDPDSFAVALACLRRRAPTVLVIAHV